MFHKNEKKKKKNFDGNGKYSNTLFCRTKVYLNTIEWRMDA